MTASPDKLRVLHLITDLGRGGAERFLLDLTVATLARPDVEFVIGALYDDDKYGFSKIGIRVVQLDYSTFSFRQKNDYSKYQHLLEEFKPDVVHTHRFLAEFLSAQHVSRNIAYVCHGHDNMVQLANTRGSTLLDKGALLNALEKRYLIKHKYRKVRTWFVANSTHTLDYYKSVLLSSMVKDVKLIPYGFDHDRFRLKEPKRTPDGRIRLVNVGSYQDKKNQKFIVEIAKELRALEMDFEIHLLGDGANRPAVQALVDAAGLGDRVTLHGNVDCVEQWLWNSDLYLHTAWYEPFGLVFLEAMAAGLPCVTLDGKGNRDVIVQDKNGYLFEQENASAFAAKIKEICESPDRYLDMSSYARDFAKQYDIKVLADRFLEFYRDCRDAVRR